LVGAAQPDAGLRRGAAFERANERNVDDVEILGTEKINRR